MDTSKVIAFVRLACSVIAAGAAIFGAVVDADALTVGALIVVALVVYIWSWWKNSNITSAAQEAQKVLDEIKAKDD